MHTAPSWWPVPILAVAGIVVALTIRHLPGNGGHIPAKGLSTSGGPPGASQLPGIALAAIAGLGLGVVLGPEAPLIALGGGLAALAARRNRANPQATPMVGSAGSFAAISTLFGSPLLGAFLLMEASGLGGAMLGLVLVPGLLAAGVGSLIFTGLGKWTGLGTYSLALPGLPTVGAPTLSDIGWSLVIGLAAGVVGTAIRRPALRLAEFAQPRIRTVAPIAAVVVGILAMVYSLITHKPTSDVLFSGQNSLGPLLSHSGDYTAWVLIVLILAKGLGYLLCLGTLRGGPVFPAMFIGAAGGLALSHLPGLPAVTGAAMGIGAMSASTLRLPLTSVLLATTLLGRTGIDTMPVVIVATVVSHVVTSRLSPPPERSHA
jgi:H+/Cl- antiporter ClcA